MENIELHELEYRKTLFYIEVMLRNDTLPEDPELDPLDYDFAGTDEFGEDL